MALKIMMIQYSEKEYTFPDVMVAKAATIKMVISRIYWKQA